MADRDDLDRLLDAALSTYADASPDLAPRVLTQVSARAATRSRRLLWIWGAGLVTAMAAALLLLIAPWHTPQPQLAPRTEASVLPPSPEHTIPAEAPSATHDAVAHAQRITFTRIPAISAPPPKQDIFPAPRPLSAEEQALAHLVAHSSQDQRRDLLAAQQQSDAPIRISDISIPPIQPPDEGKE